MSKDRAIENALIFIQQMQEEPQAFSQYILGKLTVYYEVATEEYGMLLLRDELEGIELYDIDYINALESIFMSL